MFHDISCYVGVIDVCELQISLLVEVIHDNVLCTI